MDTVTLVQIHDEADCISHIDNTLVEGMHSVILSSTMVHIRIDWVNSLMYDNRSTRRRKILNLNFVKKFISYQILYVKY